MKAGSIYFLLLCRSARRSFLRLRRLTLLRFNLSFAPIYDIIYCIFGVVNKFGVFAIFSTAFVIFWINVAEVRAAIYYVCDSGTSCNARAGGGWATGSDSNSTSQAQSKSSPWKSLDHAEENVGAGDTVIVGDGIYSGRSKEWIGAVLWIQARGSSGRLITFKSENKWGAVIDGKNSGHSGIWLDCNEQASYIRIENFEIKNFPIGGVNSKDTDDTSPYTRCNHIELRGLNIHNVGRSAVTLQEVDNALVEETLIHTLTSSHSSHNQYHGLYISDNTRGAIIRNNVIYGVPEGWPIHVYDGHGRGGRAENHLIINNTLVNDNAHRNGGLVLYGIGHIVRNNLIYNAVRASSDTNAMIYDKIAGSGTVIENNISNVGSICSFGCSSALTRGNIFNVNLTSEFANSAGRNYALKSGARSIDAGSSADAPGRDFVGASRPHGGGFDVGAYEFGSTGTGNNDTITPGVVAGESCESLKSGSSAFSPYGLHWDWTTAQRELLLKATCNSTNITIDIGNGREVGAGSNMAGLTYVYHQGYYSTGSGWLPYALQCSASDKTKIVGVWCKGSATASLPSSARWFVGYTCIWNGSRWECGCSDSTCATSYWQVQGISR